LIGYGDDSCQWDLDGRKVSKAGTKMQDVSRGTKSFSGECWMTGVVPRGTLVRKGRTCSTWNTRRRKSMFHVERSCFASRAYQQIPLQRVRYRDRFLPVPTGDSPYLREIAAANPEDGLVC